MRMLWNVDESLVEDFRGGMELRLWMSNTDNECKLGESGGIDR